MRKNGIMVNEKEKEKLYDDSKKKKGHFFLNFF